MNQGQQAIEKFWTEVERAGTPLVEPSPNSPSHALVTFLWRGGDETRNVVVFSGITMFWSFSRGDLVEHQMQRIPRTDVWFKTYELPRDTRFAYYLSPNDSLIPSSEIGSAEEWERRSERWRADPLNPRQQVRPHGERDWVISLVELPDAPPKPWESSSAESSGSVEEHRFDSNVLGTSRRLWIYLPPRYSVDPAEHPLVVKFDGSTESARNAAEIVDYLAAERLIDAPVVVEIEQKDRWSELSYSDDWNRFLVTELVPWIRQKYRVASDPNRTVAAGGSLGGLAALFAGLRHPEIFGGVLSTSGFVSWRSDTDYGWIMRQFATAPKYALRFYLDVGTFERDQDALLLANRHLRDVLLAKGYEVHYREFSGGHDSTHSAVGFSDGLQALLPRHRILFDSNRGGSQEVYVVNGDGSNVRQLTNVGRNDVESRLPHWSPDRKQIVFQSNRDGNWELYVMNSDGSEVRRLTHNGENESGPAWSPDGKQIAYSREIRDPAETYLSSHIWIVNPDRSNPRRLTQDNSRNWYPAWSPDGRRIAFVSNRSGNFDIFVMNSDGSEVRQLTDHPAADAGPAWSPDGKEIAFDTMRDGNWEIYAMQSDGSNPRRLTNHQRSDARPTWSPNGREIAFNCGPEGKYSEYEICVVRVDGSGFRTLTNNTAADLHPDWR